MATAAASWRQLIYCGRSTPCSRSSANASHTGGHSVPGEEKTYSTPARSKILTIALPPCIRNPPSFGISGLGSGCTRTRKTESRFLIGQDFFAEPKNVAQTESTHVVWLFLG